MANQIFGAGLVKADILEIGNFHTAGGRRDTQSQSILDFRF